MRQKVVNVKKRMVGKSKKAIIRDMVVSYMLFVIGFLLMVFNLDGNSFIANLLGGIFTILFIVVELYLGWYLILASWKEDSQKKKSDK